MGVNFLMHSISSSYFHQLLWKKLYLYHQYCPYRAHHLLNLKYFHNYFSDKLKEVINFAKL